MEHYDIASTVIQYLYHDDTNEYVVYIMSTEGDILGYAEGSRLMTVSISSDGKQYDIEVQSDADYPSDTQKIVLDANDENSEGGGAYATGFYVQNRAGLGTVDFRDCGRIHTWYLDEAPTLYIYNYPEGDDTEPLLWVGVGNDFVDASYVYKDTCG